MTGFEFDTGTTPGTNRSAAVTECATCGGDRFVQVGENEAGTEVYMRCPGCNPPTGREHVPVQAWWKE